MRLLKHLICFLALLFGAPGQESKPAAPPAPPVTAPPVASSTGTFYPLPAEDRSKIRDLQISYDQLEIENQKLLLRIEQNKSQQAELMNGIRQVAFDFAQKQHLDLGNYELDPKEIRFQEKKPAVPKPVATK